MQAAMSVKLRGLLDQSGWHNVPGTNLYCKRISETVEVRLEVGEWWLRRTLHTSRSNVNARDVLAAAALMGEIELAATIREFSDD